VGYTSGFICDFFILPLAPISRNVIINQRNKRRVDEFTIPSELNKKRRSLVEIIQGSQNPTEEHKSQKEKKTNGMKCPNDSKCYRLGSENVPKVKLIAKGELLECLNECGRSCRFGVDFGSGVFCECPIRNHIAKSCISEKP